MAMRGLILIAALALPLPAMADSAASQALDWLVAACADGAGDLSDVASGYMSGHGAVSADGNVAQLTETLLTLHDGPDILTIAAHQLPGGRVVNCQIVLISTPERNLDDLVTAIDDRAAAVLGDDAVKVGSPVDASGEAGQLYVWATPEFPPFSSIRLAQSDRRMTSVSMQQYIADK